MEDEELRWLAKNSKREEVRRDAINELLHRATFPNDTKIKIRFTKALEVAFEKSTDPADAETAALFAQLRSKRRLELEAGLFKQRTRLVEAERALAVKETKKALNEKRIAADKVEWHRKQLENLASPEVRDSDCCIYPMWYTLILANVDGKRAVMPMRYHCRQNGKPENIDKQFDGLYCARRDSLEGYWKKVWGKQHGILVARAFYENVPLEAYEHRPLGPGERSKNLVLEFKPQATEPMLLAVVWDCWQSPGESDLYSFAVITDDPPSEVAATGHDRCPIPIKSENIDAWLSPEGRTKDELQAILEDRERYYYEHQRMAA
jgi:putative SOS response-associated peptidase YedK